MPEQVDDFTIDIKGPIDENMPEELRENEASTIEEEIDDRYSRFQLIAWCDMNE